MRETILERFAAQVAERGDAVALRAVIEGGSAADSTLTWREWSDASARVAAALVAAGIAPGERVAILAGNGYLWPIADLGVLAAGIVSVGIYPTSAPAQLRDLLVDVGATAVIVDRAALLERILAIADGVPSLRFVVCEERTTLPDARDVDAAARLPVVGWADWLAGGDAALRTEAVQCELAERQRAIAPDSLAVLIHTSGSTGVPKAACIPHRYLLASAESVRTTLGLTPDDTTLSFLPFSHAGERVFGLAVRVHCGMTATLVEDHGRVWQTAARVAPSLFGGLPRFYEKAAAQLRAARDAAEPDEQRRWDRAELLGRERSRLRRASMDVPDAIEREWAACVAPAQERVRALFGGGLRHATSGGAMLPPAISEYLDAFGVTVLGAYGMTEQLCVAFNRPARYAFDGVGPLMDGAEARVADDGELLVRRGPLTFAGYFGRPAETALAFTADGEWLRTGDLARLDGDGVLRIVGRSKELIALSNGKKIVPGPIEMRLSEDGWVAHAMLVGEGRHYVGALLALDRAHVEAWAASEHLGVDYPDLLLHPTVHARVQQLVDRVNVDLSRPEQVKRFALIAGEFTVEGGELTPTLKLRRGALAERFAAECLTLYDAPTEGST